MESQIIVDCFLKSVEMHGLRYNKNIGDGFSNVYKKIIVKLTGLLHKAWLT